MQIHDLFNSTVRPRAPRGEPVPAGEGQPTTVGSFVTPQSLVSFPLATALVSFLWQLAKVLSPFGKSPWVPMGIGLGIEMLIYFISICDKRLNVSRRDKVIGFFIAILNSLVLAGAALGISLTIQS